MSELFQVQQNLSDTSAAIQTIETAIAQDPESPSLLLSAISLRKRFESLEKQFLSLAKRAGKNVCSYRLFQEEESPSVGPMSESVGGFQKLFSSTFHAIKSGPKARAGCSAENANLSAFGLGYSFSGSIGLVLTLENENLLFGKTEIDLAVRTVFRLANADSPEEIRLISRELGHGPVRAFHSWVRSNASRGLGVDMDWRRGESILSEVFIQTSRFQDLERILEEASEETTEEISVEGTLIAVSIARKTFHMSVEGAEDVSGRFEDAIDSSHSAQVPARYRALLTKRTRTIYSMEDDVVEYFLRKLELK